MADKSAGWLALAGTVGAIFGAVVTGGFNYLGHRGDLDVKMIELSVGILRSEPRPETEPLRAWAVDTISKHARFEFDMQQRSALLKKELPFQGSDNTTQLAVMLQLLGAQGAQSAERQEDAKKQLDTLQALMKMLKEENEKKK
jgi:hypothetical protein